MLTKYLCFITAMIFSSTISAAPLTITNAVGHDITVAINGLCSHEYGVIKSMSNGTVDEATLVQLCRNQAGHCLAQLYNSTICRDKLIANFYFNTSKGTTGEGATVAPYHLTYKPFDVLLSAS